MGKGKLIFIIVFLAVAIIAAIVWYVNYNKYVSSDDANLDTFRISVAPQVTGLITGLYVKEGDTVKKGELLFELDTTAIYSNLLSSQAHYEQIKSQINVAEAVLDRAEKDYQVTVLKQQLNKKNFDRAKEQYKGDVIPLEEFQTQEEIWKSSNLQVEIAKKNIISARASLNATIKSADAAKQNSETTLTDFSYYKIFSPSDGIIGKRWLLAGDVVKSGETVFTLNKGNDIWVSVFLEETKFKNIYLGQTVKFTLDAYDKLTFFGKIYYIGDNTASEFALIPSKNASGNFTKVTQRIPLKVSIDNVEGNEKQKSNMKLVSGMSATVKIIKSDKSSN